MVVSGMTNQEIALALHITVATVKKHLTRAMERTGHSNRTQLTLAWRAGIDIRPLSSRGAP